MMNSIAGIVKSILIGCIRLYQKTLSPDTGLFSPILRGRVCRHHPSCSNYAIEVLRRYPLRSALQYINERVLSCTPSQSKSYHPAFYKVVFMSSAPIGVPFLQTLADDKRFEIVGVVTMPDVPVGRGNHMQANIIKTEAVRIFSDQDENGEGYENDMICTPSAINPLKSLEGKNFAQWLQHKEPDFLVVIAYGKILPQSILDIPKIAPINIHGSILPKYRGATPIQSVLLDDQKETGITIIKIDAGCDTGDIIKILKFPLSWDDKSIDIINTIKKVGPSVLGDVLRRYGSGDLIPYPQDNTKATTCTKIEKNDGLIHPWSDSLSKIYNTYRAYHLWPKIFFVYQDKRYIITELVLHKEIYELDSQASLFDMHHQLHDAVSVCMIQPENKKPISYADWYRGYIKK